MWLTTLNITFDSQMLVTVEVRTFNLFKSYITNPTFSRKTLAYHRKFMPNTWKQKVKIYHGKLKNSYHTEKKDQSMWLWFMHGITQNKIQSFTSWPRPWYLNERGKWRRTNPRPSSESKSSGVSLGIVLGSCFLGFSPAAPSLDLVDEYADFENLGKLLLDLGKSEAGLEESGSAAGEKGQSRDQWPGRPHL